MKKRLICLLLSVVMMLACLVGCAQKTDEEAIDDVNEQASESALTLVMYLLAEEKVSPEQEQKIEEAVNKITKAKFKAQLDLKFFTAEDDEYYKALESAFAARLEAEEAGLIVEEEESDAPKEDETFENDYGMVEIKYPTVSGYQVDIFYLGGYEKFSTYREMGMLQNLNEELNSASKIIKEYISQDLLEGAKTAQGGVYALPTNTGIGEYTYLLLNKEALSDLRYNTDEGLSKFKSFTGADTQKFLSDISKYYGKYVPLYSDMSNTELASIQGIKYWGVDENGELCDDFSIIGSNYAIGAKFGTEESYMPTVNNLFTTTTFYSAYLDVVMDYRANGYFGTRDDLDSGKVAMACLKGSPEIAHRYSDKYVAVPISTPVLKTEDLYRDMFAVSSYTSSVSRSMKVLTYLNTNEEFRNLILYGIEGENYKFVESDYKDADGNPYMVVERNGSYMMDVDKTGNTFLAYPQVGEDPTLIEFIKEQNRNVSTSTIMGFRLDYDDNIVNAAQLQQMRALSAEVKKLFDEATASNYLMTKLKVNSLLTNKANATLIDSLCSTAEPAEGSQAGIAYVYTSWAIANKLYVPPTEE